MLNNFKNLFKITLIGSGDTLGTPVYGSKQASDRDPKSKRFRFGVLIECAGKKILIDANPDLKWQCLNSKFELKGIDYILLTHSHSDHINGLGEFFYRRILPTECFHLNDPLTLGHIDYWRYLEKEKVISFREFEMSSEFYLSPEIKVKSVEMNHGFPCSGFVIEAEGKRVAIITDSNADLAKESIEALMGCNVALIDSFSENFEQVEQLYRDVGEKPPSDVRPGWFHMTIEESMELSQRINAGKAVSVHMSRYMAPHDELVAKYQTGKFLIGYDGLEIEL